jgi:hypothetical protein
VESKKVYQRLHAIGKRKGALGAYVTEAIERFTNPPYRLQVPGPRVSISIERLLRQSHELIFVGLTLKNIPKFYADLLQAKVKKRAHMTFITIKPDVGVGHPLYEMLRIQTGNSEFVNSVISQAQASSDFFKKLRGLGQAHGTRVNVRCCEEVPTFGLVITNPRRASSLMRVNIYRTLYDQPEHPFFEISQQSEEGRQAYEVFYGYYENLLQRSKEVP